MILRLSNGVGELRPANVVAGQWTQMDGQSSWDSYGGSCGFLAELSYRQMLDCHPGETVVGLDIWNDSGWLYPDGYQVLVDNVTYGGERVSNQDVDVLTRPVERPMVGATVEIKPESGTVLVRLPEDKGTGTFVPLADVATVPVGSVVDTRQGEVRLRSAVGFSGPLESGTFSKGVFRIVHPRRLRDAGITELRMRGSVPGPCPAADAWAARLVRRLYSDVRRRPRSSRSGSSAAASAEAPRTGFRVRGRHSTATAQDAAWTTSDRCDGTLTRVTRGELVLQDLRRERSIVLGAGEGYLARP
jgi:hypothetical protein